MAHTLTTENVKDTLNHFSSSEAASHVFSLSEHLDVINRIFGSDSVEKIVELLREEQSQFTNKALKSIEAASPTSIKVTSDRSGREQS